VQAVLAGSLNADADQLEPASLGGFFRRWKRQGGLKAAAASGLRAKPVPSNASSHLGSLLISAPRPQAGDARIQMAATVSTSVLCPP
jgi:hypothetical protein